MKQLGSRCLNSPNRKKYKGTFQTLPLTSAFVRRSWLLWYQSADELGDIRKDGY
jgi:hypothetical protein